MKQRTISLRIDPIQTRSRVAQFFDSTTRTIVNELLQNARRAGATRVDITASDDAVTIKDDGSGIKDPAVLLNFGRSHWAPDTLQRELPAGMGLASLARRTATIETRPPGAEPEDGWCVTLTPAHWRGEKLATVDTKTVPEGTSVMFKLLESDHEPITSVLRTAARYYPVHIVMNGKSLPQEDFLARCVEVRTFPGGRIGAMNEQRSDGSENYSFHRSENYSFHGARARGPGTAVHGYALRGDGKDRTRTSVHYKARFEIDNNQGIQLVLPTRTHVITDEKTHRQVDQANAFLWATMVKHHPDILVTAADRRRIAALELPTPEEPPQQLRPWAAEKADVDQTSFEPERDIRPSPAGPWIMDPAKELLPPDQAVVNRALTQAGLTAAVFEPDKFLVGYAWYDRLPRIRKATLRVATTDGTTDLEEIRKADSTWSSEEILKVEVVLDIDGGEQRILETDIVFLADEEPWEPELYVAKNSEIDHRELTDLIYDAWFSPSDDCEADSYHTQAEKYRDTARYTALSTLKSTEAAEDHHLTKKLEQILACTTMALGDTVNIRRIEHGYDIQIARAAQ